MNHCPHEELGLVDDSPEIGVRLWNASMISTACDVLVCIHIDDIRVGFVENGGTLTTSSKFASVTSDHASESIDIFEQQSHLVRTTGRVIFLNASFERSPSLVYCRTNLDIFCELLQRRHLLGARIAE
jgi:hypothetical protein